eukprot:TRINITY_DN11568_c0_g1_i2.p1 TRINITY_DN11568_c0_g1~~TRINITY_DN11568_c0_g1_i2.p1  ORF type:complete len:205 (-),score=0.63 TRINITY_DN11568_c0_g1_i2:94-708(-)
MIRLCSTKCTNFLTKNLASEIKNVQLANRLSTSIINSKKLTIISDLKELPSSPKPALYLGLAGVIPFAAGPLYMLNSGFLLPDIVTAQLAYGATILSFLGGVRWGLLVKGDKDLPPSWAQYTWAVTPSLLAWVSILLPDIGLGVSLCASSLALTAYLDLTQSGYVGWFRGLRFLLSFFAVLSLIATLFCINKLGVKKHASDYLS